ncbi:ankyrin repeat domain-containing protein 6 isoform X3 [Etheostoma spectabile]|uniref:ankyrin repeat domain-containing protein 6 isoform X3 n=1 Tax=Etheostoma spectabile TaxID=54343 RepID=UPI0013AF92D2|nr:ankyrin repeat domain-containing protein 6-like isoform X3 [Etheostoma spectabile]
MLLSLAAPGSNRSLPALEDETVQVRRSTCMSVCTSAVMSHQAPVHDPSPPCQRPGLQTALHRAAMVGNSNVTAALIQGGCAVDLQDREGNTALHEASWHGFSHCVKLLVKSGADVHIRNKTGNTALHLACQNAHAPTARLLLLGGSAPDTKNNRGDTCLHTAARYNNLTLVKILLSSLCSVKERNRAGDTALHVAAALNHQKTVQLLLEAGTDGKIRNKAGKTALDMARDNNYKDMAHLLARAPQVHHFMRGRTIRKQRERVTAERRTQSDPRVEIPPNKDSSSAAMESPSSGQTETITVFKVGPHQQNQQHHHKSPAAIRGHRKRRRGKDPGGQQQRHQASNRNDLRKGKNDIHVKKNLLRDDGEDSAQKDKIYQLYTLYRDKDGNVRQAPADGCRCRPLLQKLEGQLRATQEEMRLHILNVQEQVNSKLGQMDHKTRHQIKVLDMLNQERAAAERKTMVYEIEQRAAQGREEALATQQAAVSHELKRWCLSQLRDMDVHLPAKAQYYKLLPSQSVEQSAADADLESLPLLSGVSGDSSTSLATCVKTLPSKSTFSLGGPETEQMGRRTYFEMKVDRSPDYENTSVFAANPPSGLLLGSVDPPWQPAGVQDSPSSAVMPLCGEGLSSTSSSSSQSTISAQGPRLIQHQEPDRNHFRELMSARRRVGIHSEGSRTLEFFINRPAEPTFSQERNNQHAVEVTQRFFETVSTQLERWYERKIAELERQTALRTRRDRDELLQQIGTLEEELQRLRTNENADS